MNKLLLPISLLRRLHNLPHMPQLTLFSDPTSKSIILSPQKPKTASASTSNSTSNRSPSFAKSSRIESFTRRGDSPNVWELHHIQEGTAASAQFRSKGSNGNVDHKHMAEGDDRAKGHPGKKRNRSPEGGGVAGSEAKRHKNAYEISECGPPATPCLALRSVPQALSLEELVLSY